MTVFLIAVVLQICWAAAFSGGPVDLPFDNRHFPLGVIGCMVGDGLCGSQETCFDDHLFGVCSQQGISPDIPNYDLTDPQRIGQLENRILKLLIDGYTWQDAYTQCIVQNLLIPSLQPNGLGQIDCSGRKTPLLSAPEDRFDMGPLDDDVTSAAYKLPFLSPSLYNYPKSDKRNEIVHIHKYFDKPAIPSRRAGEPPIPDILNNYEKAYGDGDISAEDGEEEDPIARGQLSGSPSDSSDLISEDALMFPSLSANLAINDDQEDISMKRSPHNLAGMDEREIPQYLINLQSLLQSENNLDETAQDIRRQSKADNDIRSTYGIPDLIEAGRAQSYGPNVDDSKVMVYNDKTDAENLLESDQRRPEKNIDSLQEPVDSDYSLMVTDPEPIQSMSMLWDAEDSNDSGENASEDIFTEDDAQMLQNLLKDSVSVNSLSDRETSRLSRYVSTLLDAVNNSQQQQTRDALTNSEPDVGDPLQTYPNENDAGQLRQVEALMGESSQTEPMWESIQNPKFQVLNKAGGPPSKKAAMMSAQFKEPAAAAESKTISTEASDPKNHYEQVDANYAFVVISDGKVQEDQALKLVRKLEEIMTLPTGTFSDVQIENGQVTFRISPDVDGITASTVAKQVEDHLDELEAMTGLKLSTAGIGNEVKVVQTVGKSPKYYTLTFVLCGCIATAILIVVVFYMFKRHNFSRQKMAQLGNPDTAEASKDYQDLCRQKMQSKSSEKPEPLHAATRIASVSEAQVRSPSSRSSTSSCETSCTRGAKAGLERSEEPVSSNMDISTGHIVLSYMEDHLQNRDRLDQEWEALCAYEADPCSTEVAMDPSNARKNRYSDIFPYDHSRVVLNQSTNASASDYINASTITDHDPKNPAYIATQGPLPHTVADFWQMVWEQGSVVIVMLTKLTETAESMCHRYWPEEGSDLYHIYEVHLVSEHIWCDDYLVRSFYLKNLQTNETRTVTQFHFLSWVDLDVPTSVKSLLDFRRKVNKSYRGRSCPIVVHCNDGCGRSGTYMLMDMVLNRMAKGAKEIDIAATLEHIRDQRMNMVKVKEQFQYALASVAEEVHAILKALPQ